MFKKIAWRELVMLGVWGISTTGVVKASDLFGTNTTPCAPHCTPASPWWGYVQTHWTRWPGAVYPDMIKAPGTSGGDEIPAPGIELPSPRKETDIRIAPPASLNKNPVSGTAIEETPHETTTEPTPAKLTPETQPSPDIEPTPSAKPSLDTKPSEMPSLKDAPGATPPSDNPFFNPPSNQQPTPPTPGSSSGTQKPKLHAPIARNFGATSDVQVVSGVAPERTEAKDPMAAKPLHLRIDVDDFTRPISPEREPELIIPSLASRPLPTVNLDTSSPPSSNTNAGGNPLRFDSGARSVVSANLNNVDTAKNYTNSAASIKSQAGNAVTSGGVSVNSNFLTNGAGGFATSSAASSESSNSNVYSSPSATTNPLR